jgi:hypothetical protein
MTNLLGTIPNFEAWGKNFGTLHVVETGSRYQDGSKQVVVRCENGDQFATLTVNMHYGELPENHFLVKTWSENEYLVHRLLHDKMFVDTGMRVGNGCVLASVWRLK